MKVDVGEIGVVLHNEIMKLCDADYNYTTTLIDHILEYCDYENLYRFYTQPDELVKFLSLLNDQRGDIMIKGVIKANRLYSEQITHV